MLGTFGAKGVVDRGYCGKFHDGLVLVSFFCQFTGSKKLWAAVAMRQQ